MTLQYNKTEKLQGFAKPTYRFLPMALSKLLVAFLALPKQLLSIMAHQIQGQEAAQRGKCFLFFLLEQYTDDKMRLAFASEMANHGLQLTIKEWRHIHQALERNLLFPYLPSPLPFHHLFGHSKNASEWYGKAEEDNMEIEEFLLLLNKAAKGWFDLLGLK